MVPTDNIEKANVLYKAMSADLGETFTMTLHEYDKDKDALGLTVSSVDSFEYSNTNLTVSNKALLVTSLSSVITPVTQQIQSTSPGVKVYVFNDSLKMYQFSCVCSGSVDYIKSLYKFLFASGADAIRDSLICNIKLGHFNILGYFQTVTLSIAPHTQNYYAVSFRFLGWEL